MRRRREFDVVLEPQPAGGYTVYAPDLPASSGIPTTGTGSWSPFMARSCGQGRCAASSTPPASAVTTCAAFSSLPRVPIESRPRYGDIRDRGRPPGGRFVSGGSAERRGSKRGARPRSRTALLDDNDLASGGRLPRVIRRVSRSPPRGSCLRRRRGRSYLRVGCSVLQSWGTSLGVMHCRGSRVGRAHRSTSRRRLI